MVSTVVCIMFVVCVLTLVVAMPSAAEIFPGNPEAKLKEAKDWLHSKGVKNFEPVSLFCDQLRKVGPAGDWFRSRADQLSIGYGKGNRTVCRCLHRQTISDKYQEGHREGHPASSCFKTLARCLPATEPALRTR